MIINKIKIFISIISGYIIYILLNFFFNSGSSFPGKISLKIYPKILKFLSKKYKIIIVTGTNGKTTTTSLIKNILKSNYKNILTNKTGANMEQSIVTTFISDIKNKNKTLAVLEIDEASLYKITKYIKPFLIIITNIFRDQLDRYGEIYNTYNLILKGIKNNKNTIIICNGDSPILTFKNIKNKILYYGFNNINIKYNNNNNNNIDGILCPVCFNILKYKINIFGNLGNYYCIICNFKRPILKIFLTKIIKLNTFSSEFIINNNEKYILNLGGIYNIYNALAAILTAKFLKIKKKNIYSNIKQTKNIFGRQEFFKTKNNKNGYIILTKNPLGFNQVINTINLSTKKNKFTLIILLNSNFADGLDTSWIWDCNYEILKFMNISKIIISGDNFLDLNIRLKISNFPKKKIIIIKNFNILINKINNLNTNYIYILSTYTSTIKLRNLLIKKGMIKNK